MRKSDIIILIDNKLRGDDHMVKVNDIYIKKISDELYLVKEFNEEKGCFYVANYTSDEIFIFFNINKKELENYSSSS